MNASRSLAGGKLFIFKIPEQDREQSTHFFFGFSFLPVEWELPLAQSEGLAGCLAARALPSRPRRTRRGEGDRPPATEPGQNPAPRRRAAARRAAAEGEGGRSRVKKRKITRTKAGAVPRRGRCWTAPGEGSPLGTPARARTRGDSRAALGTDGRTDARTTVLPLRPAT